MNTHALSHVADDVLMRQLDETVANDRSTTALLLAQIGEVEARRLHVGRGYSSMYRYCTGHLRMSEDVAYKRVHAARAARRCPRVFGLIEAGQLHVSGLVLLAPYLRQRQLADELLAAAAHRSKAEIQLLLAERFPRPDLPTRIEPTLASVAPLIPVASVEAPITAPTPAKVAHIENAPASPQQDPDPVEFPRKLDGISAFVPAAPPRVTPLAPARFALQVTIGADTHELLREAQALLAHALPAGDLDRVLHRALSDLVARLRARKFRDSSRPSDATRRGRPNERRIPAAIRRAVAKRDGHRCTFVSDTGQRCGEHSRLEFDHVEPVARGGLATAANLRLRCRAHNRLEAERVYGVAFMSAPRERRPGSRGAPPAPHPARTQDASASS